MPTTSPSKTSMSAGSSTPFGRGLRVEDRGGVAIDLAGDAARERVEVVELAADHLGDELVAGQVADEVLADERAVAQHGDAVGDLVDLVEEVGDEEDGDAAVAQVADDAEELLDLAAVEAGGRLVEHEHASSR